MARAPKQLKFTETLPIGSTERSKMRAMLDPRLSHGGNPSIKRRKTARPFAPKAPLHLVLRSARAKGTWSLLHHKNKATVTSMIYVYADRFKVTVYRAANLGNHIHLLVKATDRKNLADFLRVLAGRIAVVVTGAQKGGYVNGKFHVAKKIGRFWDYLYWSRLVNWGADFYRVRKYVLTNELEAFSREHREAILDSICVDEWSHATKSADTC
ncbi:MAG: transposase [Bdellovibrionales bacterium]|nr:transposase [Oligoflexia bacterium]